MSALEQITREFAHFPGGTRVLEAAVRSLLQRIHPLLASSFLDSPRAPLHLRGSPTLLSRRLAAYGRRMHIHLDPLISPSSTPENLQNALPQPHLQFVFLKARGMDLRIPFHECLARWFPHGEIHFLQALSSYGAQCVSDPSRSEPLPAASPSSGVSGVSPAPHSSTLPTHQLTVPSYDFAHPYTNGHSSPQGSQGTRHLDILGSMLSPAVNLWRSKWSSLSFWGSWTPSKAG